MLKQAKNRSVTYIKGATQVVSRVVVNRYIGRYLAFFYFCLPDIWEDFYFDGAWYIFCDRSENISS